MLENTKKAKEVWTRYLQNESKSSIAKALKMQRTEVIAITKYTTLDMFIDITNTVAEQEEKYQALRVKANRIINKKKEIITALENKILELEKPKFSIMGKKVF